MIYDVRVTYNNGGTDVRLDATLGEDYSELTYSFILTNGEEDSKLHIWLYKENSANSFKMLKQGDVPEWFRQLARHLTPRMEEMFGQPEGTRISRWVEEAA